MRSISLRRRLVGRMEMDTSVWVGEEDGKEGGSLLWMYTHVSRLHEKCKEVTFSWFLGLLLARVSFDKGFLGVGVGAVEDDVCFGSYLSGDRSFWETFRFLSLSC